MAYRVAILCATWILSTGAGASPPLASCGARARTAQELYEVGSDSATVDTLRAVLHDDGNCVDALWRLAYVRLDQAHDAPRRKVAEALWSEGDSLARKAVETTPNSADARFVAALSTAVRCDQVAVGERLALSKVLRRRIAVCLAADPDHAGAWYLLGKWHEGLSSLNLVERKFADLVLGGMPPGASSDSARLCLEKALSLRPRDPQFILDLATLEDAMGDRRAALATCRRAEGLPGRSGGDRRNLEAIGQERRKLGG
jgi:hypothetical protein